MSRTTFSLPLSIFSLAMLTGCGFDVGQKDDAGVVIDSKAESVIIEEVIAGQIDSGLLVAGDTEDSQKYFENSINTTSWKTYRNEEYGFEVKYPVTARIAENGSNEYHEIVHIVTDTDTDLLRQDSRINLPTSDIVIYFYKSFSERTLSEGGYKTTVEDYINRNVLIGETTFYGKRHAKGCSVYDVIRQGHVSTYNIIYVCLGGVYEVKTGLFGVDVLNLSHGYSQEDVLAVLKKDQVSGIIQSDKKLRAKVNEEFLFLEEIIHSLIFY